MARTADRDASETRRSILEAAVVVLEKVGPDSLRLSDVAVTANVGTPTIYYHFKSREDLILSAQLQILSKVMSPQTGYQHQFHVQLDEAIDRDDRDCFWRVFDEYLVRIWESDPVDQSWAAIVLTGVGQLTADRRDALNEVQGIRAVTADIVAERTRVLRRAQEKGWIAAGLDDMMLNIVFFISRFGRTMPLMAAEFKVSLESVRSMRRAILGE